MTGSNMGGLFVGFAKYICIFFGVVFGIAAFFTTGWVLVALAMAALVLLGLGWKFHVDIRQAEEAYYASRRESEASMRRNNPFYNAMHELMEELNARDLRSFTIGQREGSAPDGSGTWSQYFLVQVMMADKAGTSQLTRDGLSFAEWQAKAPSAIGKYPVVVQIR
ncbi:hypothetical protein BH11CYA1_BH11CYA1_08930 [soil metagenome]